MGNLDEWSSVTHGNGICLGGPKKMKESLRNVGIPAQYWTARCPNVTLKFYIFVTDLLIAWSRVLLEKLTGFQLVKKFPAFYGTRKLITAFTSSRHLSLSWASSIQSIPPHRTSWRSIIILSSHLRLGLASGLFSSGFPPLLSPRTCYMSHPSHSSWFYHPHNTG